MVSLDLEELDVALLLHMLDGTIERHLEAATKPPSYMDKLKGHPEFSAKWNTKRAEQLAKVHDKLVETLKEKGGRSD